MKLILLYGPPAVGKYTIAKELENLTGYKNFHNHLVLDILKVIFGKENPEKKELGYEIRRLIVEEAAKSKIDLIVTGVILNHNKFLYESMISSYRSFGGEVCLVRLIAKKEVLLERVENENRKNKFNSRQDLEHFLDKYPELLNIFSEEEFEINTEIILPKESALKIVNYFGI